MTIDSMLGDLQGFLYDSPTPFHAVASISTRLQKAGFDYLDPEQDWQLTQGQTYYTKRNGSSIIAFRMPKTNKPRLHMIGAHTDSPCLRVKPMPENLRHKYHQLGVEVYGGALLHPWFDRDLSLAGKVVGRRESGQLATSLVDFKAPIAVIPSLAIHLNRQANKGSDINPQTDLPAIIGQQLGDDFDLRKLLQTTLAKQGDAYAQILDYELSFYDSQAPSLVGLQQEYLSSARLDNLLSCYVGLQALLQANTEQGCLLVCNDHEEVGSQSAEGAQGNFLMSVLERIYPNAQLRHQVIHRSVLMSTDNAHAIHPNFANKHEPQHAPLMNHGPVIKINANQRYATNAETSALIKHLAQSLQVPLQTFVVRSDMACGSTIGPITAAQLGIKTIDIGLPTLAMHSIRELAGCEDVGMGIALLKGFYESVGE